MKLFCLTVVSAIVIAGCGPSTPGPKGLGDGRTTGGDKERKVEAGGRTSDGHTQAAEAPARPVTADDARAGLELKTSWAAESWKDTCPAQVSQAEGKKPLHMSWDAAKAPAADKAAIGLLPEAPMALKMDGHAFVYAYNPGAEPVKVALAVNAGEQWVYYESPAQAVKPGSWEKISINLGGGDYKSEAAKWEYKSAIKEGDDVRKVMLVVYHGGHGGALWLGPIGVPQGEPKAKPVEVKPPENIAPPPPPKKPPPTADEIKKLKEAVDGLGKPEAAPEKKPDAGVDPAVKTKGEKAAKRKAAKAEKVKPPEAAPAKPEVKAEDAAKPPADAAPPAPEKKAAP
jgi:hypothetical protein